MSRLALGLLLGGLTTVGGLAVWALLFVWRIEGDQGFTLRGWIAMALGAGLSAALAGGLMWLAFHSSRRGWDDIDREP